MIRRQLPTGTVVSGFEAMGDPQMAAKHLRGIPALEADDVILVDRAPDRNRRRRQVLCRGGTPETGERLMHLRDQCRKLFGRDLVVPHITADDFRDPIEIDL
jgi:hypothetical protein